MGYKEGIITTLWLHKKRRAARARPTRARAASANLSFLFVAAPEDPLTADALGLYIESVPLFQCHASSMKHREFHTRSESRFTRLAIAASGPLDYLANIEEGMVKVLHSDITRYRREDDQRGRGAVYFKSGSSAALNCLRIMQCADSTLPHVSFSSPAYLLHAIAMLAFETHLERRAVLKTARNVIKKLWAKPQGRDVRAPPSSPTLKLSRAVPYRRGPNATVTCYDFEMDRWARGGGARGRRGAVQSARCNYRAPRPN
ncbi:hypothetical protein EVAR_33936_1 [Eumeta japonica]|uniref:Uncharacterized protein n=1 Tax=Eumeta variegata TaxID=151549 RepID=A0A4C1VW59_EUMVA|nr:hypothetical protein EVAR_33936_1 [Eumeta japonica]